MYAVGGVVGLLQVRHASARSWILNVVAGDRRRMFGLGSYPSVLLEAAREKARRYRAQLENGEDPIEARRKAKAALLAERGKVLTFDEAVKQVLAKKSQEFRNKKHAAQWEATLRTYASPILGPLSVAEIETAHVLKAVEPIWATKTETATRVRQRIETVLDWARASKYRTAENPARWKGCLDHLLPKPSLIRMKENFSALPYVALPEFLVRLRTHEGTSVRALEFAILTAARSGEVRGARWSEFDVIGKVWSIPANRMKMKKDHRVPLSDLALDLLAGLPVFQGTDLLFPSNQGGPLSDTALLMVLRRMQVDAVPHGFRATFKTWATEQTHVHRNIIEASLAHTLGDKVEEAYMRGDLLNKRRELMDAWAMFCQSGERELAT
jgi:integrase